MDKRHRAHAFAGRLVMLGFGCIGQGVLPLLLRHIELAPGQVRILCPDRAGQAIAEHYGVRLEVIRLTEANYQSVLQPLLDAGDFLLNLSVGVSSLALIRWCQERAVLYLDTCSEPWAGGYTDPERSLSQRSNYALREAVLGLRRADRWGATAVLTHGANPGLVSHFVKQALLNLAADSGESVAEPRDRRGWALLAQRLGIRCIHIAERDSQYGARHKLDDEFVNTWSVEGFIGEACQPAELGWGSHEKRLPADGQRHAFGCQAAIYLQRPGAATRVRTWTPLAGPTLGYLVSHSEAISIADYLTLGRGAHPQYRPTVHYAYRPCDDGLLSLHELAARNWRPQSRQRLLGDDLIGGIDELGVLLMGHGRRSYWYGSRLAIEQARALCPHNNATSLQVSAAVLAGVCWAMANPGRGLVEPDELPHGPLLDLCRPYLGEVLGVYADWTPLVDRERLVREDLDRDDPWQFKNFRLD
ncbi:MAG TPA: saccharopine dehydrogenase C-terminal domain-containing protein [Pseudomonas sp.]|nr:saccharopine dehydrogenase C-terminal domain-containing protein [Pseudomonas sp.]